MSAGRGGGQHESARCRRAAAERADTLVILHSLSDDEWNAPSGSRRVGGARRRRAHGQHPARRRRPSQMPDVSGGTEAAMEGPVAERRPWTTAEVLDEYETYSGQVDAVVTMAQDPPMAETVLPLGDLGTHPMSIFASMFCFDNYCHLRHDILVARAGRPGRAAARRHARSARPSNGCSRDCPGCRSRRCTSSTDPSRSVLTGPGGGTWTIAPGGEDGRVAVTEGAAGDAAATITSDAHDFVAWATHRRPWSECVTIEGDEPYASTVLDAMHVF